MNIRYEKIKYWHEIILLIKIKLIND